jgi:hypothetical protein
MYRYLKAETGVSADSTLTAPVFGPLKMVADQVQDLQEFSTTVRIVPGASEAPVAIAPVVNGYFIAVFSDYPVMVRLNGPSATQFTMKSNNVPIVNFGSPSPNMCIFMMTGTVTSLYLAPISGSQVTANVKVTVTGDPTNVYT